MIEVTSTIYESEELRVVTGPAIRPGGVELTARAVEFCAFPAGARLLDVGCGEGATVKHLRDRYQLDASGVDISSRLLADGKERDETLPIVRAQAEHLPYESGALDGILCECVLSLLPEPEKALLEFHRVLAPAGHLILSDIYVRGVAGHEHLPEGAADGCLKGALPIDSTATMLEETGFTILIREDHTRYLRELAARLILANGSLDGVCAGMKFDGHSIGRPGYYLMVARKLEVTPPSLPLIQGEEHDSPS